MDDGKCYAVRSSNVLDSRISTCSSIGLERLPTEEKVEGSSPSRCAKLC